MGLGELNVSAVLLPPVLLFERKEFSLGGIFVWGIVGVMVFILLLIAFWPLWWRLAVLALMAGVALVMVLVAMGAVFYFANR